MTGTKQKQQEAETHGMEYKCVGVSGFKALDGDDEGTVVAIVSVTGLRDNVKDVIRPGAYEKSLKARTPKGVWHHTWAESVSRTEDIKELLPGDPDLPETLPDGSPWPKHAGALQVKTRFNLDTQRGREAYADVKFFGDQQEWSIGYNVPVGGATIDSKSGVRTIHTLDLYEYSPVLFGAMPSARTSSVKDAQMAYKSLLGEDVDVEPETETEPPETDPEVETTPNEPEEVEVDDWQGPDTIDYEGKEWGFLDDEGYFVKAGPRQIMVGAGQAQKVYRAIASLTELLRDMQVDISEDMSSQQQQAAGVTGDEGGETGGDQPDFESTSLSALVGKTGIEDEDVSSAATDFDTAFKDEDREAMEDAADAVIDAVEVAIEDGEDKSKFSMLGGYIAWAVEQVGDPEESGEGDEDPADEETKDEKKSDSTTEKKSLQMPLADLQQFLS